MEFSILVFLQLLTGHEELILLNGGLSDFMNSVMTIFRMEFLQIKSGAIMYQLFSAMRF